MALGPAYAYPGPNFLDTLTDTVSGPVLFPNGAVGAPSVAIREATTGLWSPAASTLAASVGGAEAWRVVAGLLTMTGRISLTNSSASNITLLFGSDALATTRQDSVAKEAIFAQPHYLNAEEPVGLTFSYSNSGTNVLAIGGGTSVVNAIKLGVLYAAANTTTVTGTGMLSWSTTGIRIQSGATTAASYLLHVVGDGAADILTASTSLLTVGIGGAPLAANKVTVYSDNSSASGLGLYDTRAYTSAGRPKLVFNSKYNAAGAYADVSFITGGKENVTDGDAAGMLAFWVRPSGGSPTESARFASTGNFLIGTTTGSRGRLVITAPAGSNLQAMTIEQLDDDEPFIEHTGTSAASAAKSISTWTTGNAVQGFIRISINGTDRWMPFYDAPTS